MVLAPSSAPPDASSGGAAGTPELPPPGVEAAEVMVTAGCCVACSRVPVILCRHSLVTGLGLVRLDEKVLLHGKQHLAWRSLLFQLFWVLILVVLQVRLSCLLRGAEDAEVIVAAGWCVASSLVLALV